MTLTIETISTTEALAQLANQWDELVARAGLTHPFLTHTWIETWWECFGGAGLSTIVARDAGRIVAIAPLMQTGTRLYGTRQRCVTFMANDHTPRCDFLALDAAACDAICEFLMTSDWDIAQLRDVPAESIAGQALIDHARRKGFLTGMSAAANSPVLSTQSTWDAYLDGLPSKRRWFLRNRMKRLSKLGRVSLETVTGGERLAEALGEGFRLEAAAWKGKAGTAIDCDPRLRRFYTLLAERAAERGWLRLQFLKVDDQRIAFAYCLAFAQRMFLLKPGFDPDYAAFSPGNLLFFLALEECFGSDVVAYDFLGYDDHWKRQWADTFLPHNTIFFYAKRPLARLDHYARFALMPRLRRARNLVLGHV